MDCIGRIGGVASVLVLVAATSGCVQYFPYKYIALDEQVVEVTARGIPHDDGEPLKDHEEMPLSYALTRPAYEITARVHQENVWQTMLIFELRSTNRTDDLFLVGVARLNCFGAFIADHRFLILPPKRHSTSLRYYWYRHNIERCAKAPEPTAAERVLLLRIEDENGKLIGEERLPFEIRQNGYIRNVTAI